MLFYRPTLEEVEEYLENRWEKAFNVIQVQLLAHKEKEKNCESQYPLHDLNDLSTPNEAFFQRVDTIANTAQDKGLLLNIAPAWLGCCEGSWRKILLQNGPDKCRQFSRYVGHRYGPFLNEGRHKFTSPATNKGGDSDFAILLESADNNEQK